MTLSPLHLFDSLSSQKRPFIPEKAGEVKLYVCGMTVYDYCHMGHGRILVFFDTLVRHLKSLNYEVQYIRNITDIDDKIIKRAQENEVSFDVITEKFIQFMDEDEKALGNLKPTAQPKATENLEAMIAIIEKLINKGLAYIASNGDVYYASKKFEDYGKLSHKNLDQLKAGERVEVSEVKKDALDFVLWKRAKENEPSWPSPWGEGRPGWHIECSAMSTKILGMPIDIHGGGMDLKFPHHENEIAQSQGAYDQAFVKTWMHVGFIQINDAKMSKSLGNFFTLREVFQQFNPEVVRFFYLSTHYRKPINYSEENLKKAENNLKKWYRCLDDLESLEPPTALKNALPHTDISPEIQTLVKRFEQALNDDMNTPLAISVLHQFASIIQKEKNHNPKQALKISQVFLQKAHRLGLLQKSIGNQRNQTQVSQTEEQEFEKKVEALIEQREVARKERDYARADEIRDELKKMNITLLDSATGTEWKKA